MLLMTSSAYSFHHIYAIHTYIALCCCPQGLGAGVVAVVAVAAVVATGFLSETGPRVRNLSLQTKLNEIHKQATRRR